MVLLLVVVVVVLLVLLLPLFSVLQAGWQISLLRAGWQIPVSAEVVRAVALVCRLLNTHYFLWPLSCPYGHFFVLLFSQHMFFLFIQWRNLPLVFFSCWRWHTDVRKLFLVPQQLITHNSHLQQLTLILLFVPHF
jgi:hypothetical protein